MHHVWSLLLAFLLVGTAHAAGNNKPMQPELPPPSPLDLDAGQCLGKSDYLGTHAKTTKLLGDAIEDAISACEDELALSSGKFSISCHLTRWYQSGTERVEHYRLQYPLTLPLKPAALPAPNPVEERDLSGYGSRLRSSSKALCFFSVTAH